VRLVLPVHDLFLDDAPLNDLLLDERKGAVGGTADQVKGHVKEAAGEVTGDRDLEREGKVDRATGEVKEKARAAKDKVSDAADAVRDKVKDALD
jgi:uncharacterized protein YjbJ (UPF0337 family)